MKYKCASPTTWKLAIGSLTTVLNTGLKVARAKPADFTNIWEDLADTFDKFLFPSRFVELVLCYFETCFIALKFQKL